MKNFFRHYFSVNTQHKDSCTKLSPQLGELLLNNFLKQTDTTLKEGEVKAAWQLIQSRLDVLEGELADVKALDSEKKYEMISQVLVEIEEKLLNTKE